MSKHTIELLKEWGCSAWEMILRTFWLAVLVTVILVMLRAMSWSDVGARGGDTPVEPSFIPAEFRK